MSHPTQPREPDHLAFVVMVGGLVLIIIGALVGLASGWAS